MNYVTFASIDANASQNFPGSSVSANALGLANPDSVLSGQMRGSQNIGSAGAALDAANNVIRLSDPATGNTIGFGSIPGSTTNEFGFFSLDSSGNLIFKIVGGTFYIYDGITKKNVIQLGKLPDATYGEAVAKSGFNVADGIS